MVVASIGWVLGCCHSSISEVRSDAYVGHMLCISESSNQHTQGMWWVYVQLWADELGLVEENFKVNKVHARQHKLS
jgi:hypothetical protein